MYRFILLTFCLFFLLSTTPNANGQSTKLKSKSVNPGINKSFVNADPAKFIERFEKEGREVYDRRNEIVEALNLNPGIDLADIGAGTGLFTRLFSPAVGKKGTVYAVDISENFIKHIDLSCREKGIKNVAGIVCSQKNIKLPANSIDIAYVCATYHHFEYPHETLTSIHQALRPGGKLIVIDFIRKKGVSSDWIMKHVRANKATVTKEILANKFKLVEEKKLFKENYLMIFEKEKA